ncbi:MAG TPA: hypothetical protein VES42_13980 [Pilimelia sp.]|nr:hypothetical protein [Pilimelia sp.]
MFRRLGTGRARAAIAAAAALALVGGGGYAAGPASAATSVVDGFEGNPYTNWSTRDTPGDSFVWLGDHTQSRTGINSGHFYAPFDVPARAYRPVVVDRPSPNPSWCYAEAWLKRAPVWHNNPGTEKKPRVSLVIRNGLVVVGGTTYTLENFEYRRAPFASFRYRQPDLTVDISVTNGMAYVDDVTVWCVQEIG